jgi:hypothetical protein
MKSLALTAASAFALALSACASTTGAGQASTANGAITATFTWKERSADGGAMTATLGTGEAFAGDYFQVTHDSRIERYAPLWSGWEGHARQYGPEWEYWGPRTEFVTEYTGRVLANLAGANGTHMRCMFMLRSPSAGMSQGGVGRCQTPDGASLDATFPGK